MQPMPAAATQPHQSALFVTPGADWRAAAAALGKQFLERWAAPAA
jgi:hypothetical protein